MAPNSRTASIAAENTFTDALTLQNGGVITLTNVGSNVVTPQRKDGRQDGVSQAWHDLTDNSGTAITFTGDGTYTIAPNGVAADFRVGVKTGDYSSGTTTVIVEGN